MQKTANYQLNQWEPTDKLSREDFNADNAAIDAAIKSVATICEVGKLSLSSASDGDILKTFDFTPSAIFLFVPGSTTGAAINGLSARVDNISAEGYRLFNLRENQLKLQNSTGTNMTSVYYVALK